MNMVSSIVTRADEFFKVTLPKQIPASQKLQVAKGLLEEARKVYSVTQSPSAKEILQKKISALTIAITKLQKQIPTRPPLALREKILADAKSFLLAHPTPTPDERVLGLARWHLQKLRQVATPPTDEEKEVISKLQELYGSIYGMLRYQKMKEMQQRGIAPPGEKVPPEIERAERFRKEAEITPPTDERSVKLYMYRAREVIAGLKLLLARLPAEKRAVWEARISQELKKIGELYRDWDKRLKAIREKEERMRTYALVKERGKYETERYVSSVAVAKARGQTMAIAERSARSIINQLEKMASMMDALIRKAQVEKKPEAIDIGKIRPEVSKAEMVAKSVIPRVPMPVQRELNDKIKLLRKKEGELIAAWQRLLWAKGR